MPDGDLPELGNRRKEAEARGQLLRLPLEVEVSPEVNAFRQRALLVVIRAIVVGHLIIGLTIQLFLVIF